MDEKNDINRLHSLLPRGMPGGLIAMKKIPDATAAAAAADDGVTTSADGGINDDRHRNGGRRSLLGLDRPYGNDDGPLRRQLQEQEKEQQQEKQQRQRTYRSRHGDDETPSHPGGVDRDAVRRAEERREREKRYRRTENGHRHHQHSGGHDGDDDDDGGSRREGDGAKWNYHRDGRRGGGEGGGGNDVVTPSTRASSAARTPSSAPRPDDRGMDDRQRGGGADDGRDRRWERHQRQPRQQSQQRQQQQQPRHHDRGNADEVGGGGGGGGSRLGERRGEWDATPLTASSDRSRPHSHSQQRQRQRAPPSSSSSSWEVETPQPIRRGGGGADDVEDRAMASLRSSSTRTTASSHGGWRGGPSGATPRGDDNDPFDEVGDLGGARSRADRPEEEGDDDGEFDRRFYLADDDTGVDDDGGGGDAGTGHGRFLFESDRTRAREAEALRRREAAAGGRQTMRQARQSALDRDQRTWEENRLLSSGAAMRSEVDLDFNGDDDDKRVQLLVHQIQPPFLRDGRARFSVIREAVPTVRDATSDFARMAREGSVTLQRLREKKERGGMRQKFWELGGSRMGDAMRVKEVKEGEEGETTDKDAGEDVGASSNDAKKEEAVDDGGEVDYKKSTGFAAHVKSKTKPDGKSTSATSEFARTKSIREQREYLPAFSVRDALLQTIRENNIVIVVGETGSGKTTQLTQYLMEEGYTEFGIVGCTQPRRVAAMSVAKRVSEEVAAMVKESGKRELNDEVDGLGGTVGYSIRFEDQTNEHTGEASSLFPSLLSYLRP